MAMFAGAFAAGLAGPLLGMIPQAPGGPANPYTGTGAGDLFGPLLGMGASALGLGGGGSGSGGGGGGGGSTATPTTPPVLTQAYVATPTNNQGTGASGGPTFVPSGGTSTVLSSLLNSPAAWAGGAVLLMLVLRK